MSSRMDNLVKDVQRVTKDIQHLKTGLQFSQVDLEDIITTAKQRAERLQDLSKCLNDHQASLNSLAAITGCDE